jgi:surfactin family lipopeptide synthetase A
MVTDLYVRLSNLKVQVQVAAGQLQVDAPKGVLTPELLGELKASKEELIALITSYQGSGHQVAAIQPAAAQAGYLLSSSQRRLWLLSQVASSTAYHIPGVFTFAGRLDFDALAYAFAQLVARHEVLRTSFREDEAGVPRQYVAAAGEAGFTLFCEDLRGEPNREAQAQARVQSLISQPFDLAAGPLVRAGVYQLADNAWLLAYVVHHIVSDGWSMGILIRELLQLYNAHRQGQPARLSPLRIQYKDYATWQQGQLQLGALAAHRAYWLRQLAAPLPQLDLPVANSRPPIKTYCGGALSRRLGARLAQGLKQLAGEQGATLFMGLLAAVNALLYRYTGQEDLLVGSPIAGREHRDLEDQIGFYVNVLALRTHLAETDSFQELLGRVKETTLGAYEHQMYPFDELVDDLDLRHDPSRSALFDVMVVLQNADIQRHEQPQQLGDLQVSPYPVGEHQTSKFDLTFNFWEVGEEIQAVLEYNSDLFERPAVERLANHLEQLLAAALADPHQPVAQLDYLSGPEKHQLLVTFNDTQTAYPAHQSVVQLFEAQVAQTPHALALAFEETTLTYQQLNEQANQLARYLHAHYAIGPDDRVGVLLEPGEWLLVAILAVLKAGGAYVPVEPTDPAERVAYLLDDSGCKAVLDAAELARFREQAGRYSRENAGFHPTPDHLCYVMYTSGTTGRPKGVLIEHRSVVRLVKNTSYVTLTGTEVLLVTGAVGFDATTFEYWAMLLNGGQVVLCRKDTLLDPQLLAAEVQRRHVTIMWFTSSWLNQLVDSELPIFAGLRTLLAGGDRLSPTHLLALRQRYPALQLINGYGPTENTTFSLTHSLTTVAASIPVGKPISNSTAYIVGPHQELLPIGVIGEIWVGGAGLARGYLNQPALTANKFVPNPFCPGQRAYRTGDLGRWLADGSIEFIGRRDGQVKIRGYRLELGEVENLLQAHPAVRSAVVVASPVVGGELQLVAYVVGTEQLDLASLKAFVGRQAPAYLVPHYVLQLPKLPLTPNGKVDRHRLPPLDGQPPDLNTPYVPPTTELEKTLVAIWQQLLGKDRIGREDNFFELGGHSLHMTRLSHAIATQLGVRLALRKLYEGPTVARLAAEVQALLPTASPGLQDLLPSAAAEQEGLAFRLPATAPSGPQLALPRPGKLPRQPHYEVTHNQRKEFIRYLIVGDFAYNISTYLVFDHLDKSVMNRVLHALVQRHESLRTVYVRADGVVRQRVLDAAPAGFAARQVDIRGQDQPLAVRELASQAASRLFAFEQEPLCDFTIIDFDDQRSALLLTLHHAISDASSMRVLETEIRQLYEAFRGDQPNPLPTLAYQYKEYAHWANGFLTGDHLANAQAFYKKRFGDALRRNHAHRAQRGLPLAGPATGRERPYRQELLADLTQVLGAAPTDALLAEAYGSIVSLVPPPGRTYRRCIAEPLLDRLKHLALSLDSSLTMLLLASLAALYSTTHEEPHVRIFVPVSTREPAEFENVVGWLMSEMILTVAVDPTASLATLVKQTMHSFFETFPYRFYPYERIMADLDVGLCQLAPLLVNYIKHTDRPFDYFPPVHQPDGSGHFDLHCTLTEYSNCLVLQVAYNAQVYDQQQIDSMFEQHAQLLEQMLNRPGTALTALH